MEFKRIDSAANPLIKEWVRWQSKASDRRKAGVVVVEGLREVERALKSGWQARFVAFRAGMEPRAEVWAPCWGLNPRNVLELGASPWKN